MMNTEVTVALACLLRSRQRLQSPGHATAALAEITTQCLDLSRRHEARRQRLLLDLPMHLRHLLIVGLNPRHGGRLIDPAGERGLRGVRRLAGLGYEIDQLLLLLFRERFGAVFE